MRTSATQPEPEPGRLVVRLEEDADIAAVREVVRAAFGEEDVAALLDELRTDPCWLGLSYVAEPDGEVVGHVSLTRAWVDDPRELVDVLVLSPLSVRPDRQHRGIGSALVAEALARADGRTEPVVFLEGDPGYYGRLGFVTARPLGFTAPSVRIPEVAFQAWLTPAYRPDLSGALVYPDVFWRHDAVGLRT